MLRPEELLNANLLLCLIYLLSFLEDGLGHGVLVWVLGRFVLDSRRVQRLAIQVLLLHLDLGQGIAVDILHCVTRLDRVQVGDRLIGLYGEDRFGVLLLWILPDGEALGVFEISILGCMRFTGCYLILNRDRFIRELIYIDFLGAWNFIHFLYIYGHYLIWVLHINCKLIIILLRIFIIGQVLAKLFGYLVLPTCNCVILLLPQDIYL